MHTSEQWQQSAGPKLLVPLSSLSFPLGCIGFMIHLAVNETSSGAGKVWAMMENVVSALNHIRLWEEWATVVLNSDLALMARLQLKRPLKHTELPSFLSLPHCTSRKFLRCKNLSGLPASPASYLCLWHTALPLFCYIPQPGGGKVVKCCCRQRHRMLDDRFVMKGWKSRAGQACWVDRPLFSTQALSNIVTEWIMWWF